MLFLNSLFIKFLWSGKKAHVKREVVIQDIEKGGLKMLDFASMIKAIKCTWVSRFENIDITKVNVLKQLVKYNNMAIFDIAQCKLNPKHITFHSTFYEQILSYWYNVNTISRLKSANEIVAVPLWHNSHITIDDKPANFKQCIKKRYFCI